ncbi:MULTISPECIES: 30S ribosomal protein S4 [Uliginosibacterium]|jgi:small subunit ribosomal protein S4|uniref:Small ribosomal subunit protein uS4 n=1 Tax=Uliginosibacterium aquaticum TaxID=2731212 RepID=A0ABX2IB94_9RHOO|nr:MULTISPECIES: 30S ribosomal protein S4 [Uliginosibacterium]MDO6386164.1 30S ribosomal protein S4 [Uliginosibacterium sp. 31-12]NSL53654.1 30S ribosomal protein S4 [Uliginosibacterium aquaticum]PLK49231.1 30S ribosomal protein S4 [Uliginosibacterium sp. TH139]
MSRYTGPRLKVMRALGVDLPGLSRKTIADRDQRPGQHGAKQQRKSGYGLQLLEKQKLRFNYGLTERQMRILVTDARRSRDSAGAKLAELLERRLDNVVFRAGFAGSIPASRQLVNHSHVLVNGKPVNIPSFRTRVGDVISIRPKSRELLVVKASLADLALTRPEWLAFDEAKAEATVSHLPDIADIPFPLEMQLVVEYYAQRL